MMRTFLERNYQGYLTTQDIRVNVDVTTPQLQYPYDQSFATHNMHPQQATLFSLAAAYLKVYSLTIDQCTFGYPNDLLAIGREEVLESISDLNTLVIKGGAYEGISIAILEGASQLRSLTLDVGRHKLYPQEVHAFEPMAPELLQANSLSNLTSLRITSAILDGALFIQMLNRCQRTLTHLVIRWVCLSKNDDDLMPIHAMMLTMPALAFLELQWVKVANIRPHKLVPVPGDGVCPKGHKYEGKEAIKAWLRELLDNCLYLYHNKPDPER